MGLTALLPLRRKLCYGFLSPLKIYRPRPGLNPRTLFICLESIVNISIVNNIADFKMLLIDGAETVSKY
jgi:hypothetical protein